MDLLRAVVCAALVWFCPTSREPPTTAPTQRRTITILPLGDSITQSGFGYLSYRYFLWESLVLLEEDDNEDKQYEFDFVGTLRDNYNGNPDWPTVNGRVFDQDHEGHWGWTIDDVTWQLSDWLSSYAAKPQIALVHLGTNNCFGGREDPTIIAQIKLKNLVDLLHDHNPNMYILMSQLIPVGEGVDPDGTIQSCLDNVNTELEQMVTTTAEQQNQELVHLVRVPSGFDTQDDLWDDVHPNAQGSARMAQAWLESIQQIILPQL